MKSRVLGEVIAIMMGIVVLAAGYEVNRNGYKSGVYHAVETWALLSLEQSIQGTNRTHGEMRDIVRQRLGVQNMTETRTGGLK